MGWDKGLLTEQIRAAKHKGSHARLLAGPGTGKTLTLTRHICYLIKKCNVPAENILAVTFTRAAARELRQRVEKELGDEVCPRISTLHSFALRQLLKNASRLTDLPQPLRIADDWEERNIIQEDIKKLLNLNRVSDAQDLLNELSADWQSLTVDESDWEKRFPEPRFLGTWREHRQIYGYTLRSELVYQLKKSLEQSGDFKLEGSLEYLLVDEYQDLNRCDLAVVQQIALRDVELFVAGDDDQSIYGFRKAHPEGIRRFLKDYRGSGDLSLEICKRCDRAILDLGLFIAKQDPRRVSKIISPEANRGIGEVAILRFQDQDFESTGIAGLCNHLLKVHNLEPDNILILLRSNRNGLFSGLIREKLEKVGIPVSTSTESQYPLDINEGRAFLAFIRLAVNLNDSLAWRTLLHVWCNGIGKGAIDAVYNLARHRGWSFAQTLITAHKNSDILPSNFRSRISEAISHVLEQLENLFGGNIQKKHKSCKELTDMIQKAVNSLIKDGELRKTVMMELQRVVDAIQATSIEELVRATEVVNEDLEQEIEQGRVNILTMHRAKGLTAEAVIVAAAEDQYIPGRARGDAVDDERRLLYVSLTRAKHHLFITYCDKRTGPQRHTGRDSGKTARSLSQFLKGSPYTPEIGNIFIARLAKETK